MDANRFDELSRTLAARSNRREAVRRGGFMAAIAGAFGLGGARALAQDDEGQETRRCEIAFRSEVVVGPNEGATFDGLLTLRIGKDGTIDSGTLETEGPRPYQVVGQAVGRALDLRIEVSDDRVLALTGVGERDVRDCRGKLSGMFGGPEFGDLGVWEAERRRSGDASPTAEADDEEDVVDDPGDDDSTSSGDTDGDDSASSAATSTPCPPENCGSTLVWNPETCACECPGGGLQCGDVCCPQGSVCNDPASGNCSCPPGTVVCGNACVAECPPGSYLDYNTCQCIEGCPSGQVLCNGACAGPCASGETLNTTTCVCDPLCPPGQQLCSGACIDVVNDAASCGSCGNVCPTGMPCIAGTCTCPATMKYCANVQMCKDENATC